MSKQRKISIIFIILLVLFEFFRTTFQAIYSLYYMDCGLSLGEVSTVKSFQIAALLIFEIPSGYLADRVGRIKTLYLSSITMGISFIGLIISKSYYSFAISEFIYGIGFALNSGTIISYINDYQKENDVKVDNSIMGYANALVSLFTFISGNIGAYLYKYDIRFPFIIAAIGMFIYPIIINYIFIWLKLTDNRCNQIVKKKENILHIIFFRNKDIFKMSFIYLVIFNVLFSAVSQIIYQYWSVYFIKILKLNQNVVFSSITIASMMGGLVFATLTKRIKFKNLSVVCVLIISIPLVLIKKFEFSLVLSLLIFTISQFGRGMMFSLTSKIENDAAFNFKNKSLILSINGTITQIFNIIILIVTPCILQKCEISIIFTFVGWIYLTIIPILLKMHKQNIIN